MSCGWYVAPDAMGLTCWERRGLDWEVKCQDVAERFKVRMRGNPRDAKMWKHRVGKGFDMLLGLDVLNDIDVECKWLDDSKDYKIQPSWIKRDYLPRFDDADSGHRHIILTNDTSKFHNDSRSLLAKHDIELWDLKKLTRHLILWTYIQTLINTIWNYITNRTHKTHITNNQEALLPPTTIEQDNLVFDGFYIPRL